MSQDHRSPLSRPSYEDFRDHGAANEPTYPSTTAPVGPPARWGGTGGHPHPAGGAPQAPEFGPGAAPGGPGRGGAGPAGYGPAEPPPGYAAPARPGLGTAEAPRYGTPETPAHRAPAAGPGFGAPEVPRHGAPTSAPPGYGVPGAAGRSTAPGYPAPAAPGYSAPTSAPPGYGAPTASGHLAPAAQSAPASWSPASAGQQPGAATEPAADGYSSQAVQNQIRQAVVHRVQYANALHASHYWDLRRTKPVGPHALVFLYASLDPRFTNPRRPYYEIKAASRLFRDGSDVRDLSTLLSELTEIAKGYLADGGVFDPVAQMTQAADSMPADVTYIGVAVSTLLGDGDDVGDEPLAGIGGMGIPGRGMVVLSDANQLVIERPARAHEQAEVYSTFPYTTSGGVEYRSWRSFTPEQQADPAWRWLQHLNQLVITGHERKAAAGAPGASGGRRRR